MSSSDLESDSKSDTPAPPPPPPKRARKQAPSRKQPSAPSFDDSDMDEDMKPSWGKGVQVDGEEKEKKKWAKGVRRTDGTGLVGPAGCASWHEQKEKYYALAKDRFTGKQVSAGYHETKEAALAAVRVKQKPLDKKYEATDVFQAALKAVEGLPPSPDDIEEVVLGKVYRHQDPKNKFLPYGAVVVHSGKQGKKWMPACAHVDPETGATWTCGNAAKQAQKGEKPRFCKRHGGRCAHSSDWGTCRECNPKAAQNANNCGSCAKRISRGRLPSNGGSGYCCDCEPVVNAQAAAAGAAPLPNGKTTEEVCKEYLLPRVVDKEGKQIYATLLDDFKNMLGSYSEERTGRRTRGADGDDSCGTFTKRRPDALWLLFNADRRIIAVLCLEIDEHSHDPSRNYASSCEIGKVEDTFQSILKITQELGKSRLAVVSRDHKYTPYVQILKLNPDACDCQPHVRRERRLEVAAQMISDFLNTPPEHYEKLSADGEANAPHVHCLYYHSKSPHLPYFAEKTVGAWDWQGNACPV